MLTARIIDTSKNWLKRTVKRAKQLACYAILLEGVVAGVSIYEEIKFPQKKHSASNNYLFSNTNLVLERGKVVLEHPLQMCASACYSLPCFAGYHLGIRQGIEGQLEMAARHEKTLGGIESLFVKDDIIDYAEIGGLIFLAKDEQGNPYIKFYDISSKNEIMCNTLQRDFNNTDKLLEYLRNEKFHYKTEIDTEFIDNLLARAERAEGEQKKLLVNKMVSYFMIDSDCLYYPHDVGIAEFFYKNFLRMDGRFIGAFHTHNTSAPPSDIDFKASRLLRSFVVVRNSDSYMLHDLYKGETRAVYKIEMPSKEQ